MSRSRHKPKATPLSPPGLEELEPRILFSADPLPLEVAALLAPVHQEVQLVPDAPAEPAPSSGGDSALVRTQEIVFIDAGVDDAGLLASAMQMQASEIRQIEVVMLDGRTSGVEQISKVLAGRHDIDAIHILSHGADGVVQLGTTSLDFDALLANARQIKGWGQALSTQADILLYGCNVADGPAGGALLDALSRLTGADVSASDDTTGYAGDHGDWVLEVSTGDIEAHIALDAAAQAQWTHTLAMTASGGETLVNTTTTGTQTFNSDGAPFTPGSVAMDSSGNYIVVWESAGDIYGQRYDSTGTAQGSEIQISTNAANDRRASVGMNASGAFVVTWDRDGGGGLYDIYARQYDASGTAVGGAFLVNSTTAYDQEQACAALDANGNFVVIWESDHATSGVSDNIYGQRYDASGTAQGSNFIVNTTTAGDQDIADVAMDDAGNFVVVWRGETSPGSNSFDIYGRRFDSAGSALAGEFRVNSSTTGNDQHPTLAMNAGGDFVVAWDETSGFDADIRAQRYNYAGTAQGGEISVTSTTSYGQQLANIAMDAGGNFVVTWSSSTQDGSSWGIYTLQYGADGSALSSETLVNTTTANAQDFSAVAYRNGHAIVVWSGDGSGDSTGIFAQRFTMTGGNTAPVIGSNGGGASAAISIAEGATAVTTVSATDADAGDVLSYAILGGTDATSFAINASSGALTFVSAPNYESPTDADADNVYDVIVRVSDGNGGTDTQLIAVTVTNANDAPVITNGASVTLTATSENTTSSSTLVSAILASASYSDADAGALSGIAITATTGSGTWQYSTDTFFWTNFGSVSPSAALLLASGTRVRYVPEGSSGETATFSFKAWDQSAGSASVVSTPSHGDTTSSGGTSAYSSGSAATSITVTAINDAPVLHNDSGSTSISVTNAGFESTVLGDATSTTTVTGWTASGVGMGVWNPESLYYPNEAPEGQNIAYIDAGGTLSQVLTTNFSANTSYRLTVAVGDEVYQSVDSSGWAIRLYAGTQLLGSVTNATFDPVEGSFTDATLILNSADLTSYSAFVGQALKIELYDSGLADNMHFDNVRLTSFTDPSFTEDGAATVLAAQASVSDADLAAAGNYNGATLTLSRKGGSNAQDRFSASGTLSTLTQGGSLVVGGTTVGTVTTNSGGTLLFTFNANATQSLVDSVLQQIAYSNSSNTPPASVQLDWTFNDANGGTQGSGGTLAVTQTTTVAITANNDAPVISGLAGDSLAFTEGSSAWFIEQGLDSQVSDVDSTNFDTGTLTVSFVSGSDAAEDVLSIFSQGTALGQIGVSGNNITYSGSVIGTFTGGSAGADLAITFNSNATPAAVDTLVLLTTYSNTDIDSPTPGTRTVRYVLTDGDGGTSANYDVTINVSAVNDAPTITNGATVNLTGTNEDTPSSGSTVSSILTSAGYADVDNSALSGIAVTATTGNGTWQYSIDGSTWTSFGSVSGTAALLLSSTSQVRYLPDGIDGETATFAFKAWDQTSGSASAYGSPSTATTATSGGASAFSSASASATITVSAVIDAPVITPVAPVATFVEGGNPQVIDPAGTVTDVDSADLDTGVMTVSITLNGTVDDRLQVGNFGSGIGQVGVSGSNISYGGVLVGSFSGGSSHLDPLIITFNANASPAVVQEVHRSIQFTNVSAAPSTLDREITFALSDGDGGTATPQTKFVHVQAVNASPAIGNLAADSLPYSEGDGAVLIDQGVDATVTDVDSPDFDTGTLTVAFVSGSAPGEDVLDIRSVGTGLGQIDTSGSNVRYEGLIIGSFTGGSAGADLVITLNSNADAAAVSALVRSITYLDTDTNAPTTGTRVVRFVLTDGDGGSSTASDTSVIVSAVNDEQVLAINTGSTVAEGSIGNVLSSAQLTTSDVDHAAAQLVYTLNAAPLYGSLRLNGIALAPGDTFTQDDIDNNRLTYDHDGSESSTDSVTFSVDDGVGVATPGTFLWNITPVNDAPSANAESYALVQDSTHAVSAGAGVLINDTDAEGSALNAVLLTSTGNGALTFNTDGSFIYVPNAGFVGTDSFTYRASDGLVASSPTTVTLTVSATTAQPDPELLPPPDAGAEPAGNTDTEQPTQKPPPSDATPPADSGLGEASLPLSATAAGLLSDAQFSAAPLADVLKSVEFPSGHPETRWFRAPTDVIGAYARGSTTSDESVELDLSWQGQIIKAMRATTLGSAAAQLDFILKGPTDKHEETSLAARLGDVGVWGGLVAGFGTAWWSARAGVLLSSVVLGTPAWARLDPLPIATRDDPDEEEDDGVPNEKHLFNSASRDPLTDAPRAS